MKMTSGTVALAAMTLWAATAAAAPPQDLAELSSVWGDHIAEQQQPLWGIFTDHWSNATPSRLKLPFTEEATTRWVIDSPPHLLLRTVLLQDGEFVEESVIGGNEDYVFKVSKRRDEEIYHLGSVAPAQGDAAEPIRQRIEGWSQPLQQRRFFLGHNGNLAKLLAENPTAFRLNSTEEGLVLSYSRDAAESRSRLGYLNKVPSAKFQLSDSRPWLPVRHEVVDLSDPSKKPISIVTSFDSERAYTRKTFHPDGNEFVTTSSSIDQRSSGDPELLALTRLSAYGFEEPAIASPSGFRIVLYLILGVALVAGGTYFLKRRQAFATQ